ncbi:membrane protein insertase YidC [Aerococcus sanguinicola]|uniref:Membrane insertase YidC/Oxa/ALB C-terminal domain-containing protein n=1 Tax=Aerococcus sanguinicola TaxID=119206 RepID=A0A0X8FAA0_9LACT|nr:MULTISPECIES: membrane protein insertase YidC [Aerococcus]AMB93478.1 hypothetical protein AWM72_01330 [Aerococcus sanguinicola]MDK7050693.1 membrane protein insertase YidC [Aerococcus sanguinicola]OFT97709.1 hypothetical protein HMPREF3090_00465 [Aerococcus sp. HMSC23C02]PKZ21793.1 hypothetical protein CYJ28_07785 [Aerococcus sanguinicola]
MFKSLTGKRTKLLALTLTSTLLLAGCANPNNPDGFGFRWFAMPINRLLNWFAEIFNGNYGLAIITMTILVRLVLLPLTMRQLNSTMEHSVRMKEFQPYMKEMQERQKNASSDEERMRLAMEQQEFLKENNISMLGGMKGCLPLLIQLPIFSGLYAAIRTSPDIKAYTFFGIPLGEPSLLFAIITIALYALQSWVSLQGIPEEQRAQMKMSMFMMPIMMGFIVFSAPAGLTLYFIVSALWGVLQSLYTNLIYRPRITARIEEEMKKNPVKVKSSPSTQAKDVTQSVKDDAPRQIDKGPKKGRNAGKQKRQ